MTEYALVGCSECHNFWIITTDGETAKCSRCGKQHVIDSLKFFAESEDREECVEARTAKLKERASS